jgi:hypothetical protein
MKSCEKCGCTEVAHLRADIDGLLKAQVETMKILRGEGRWFGYGYNRIPFAVAEVLNESLNSRLEQRLQEISSKGKA